jgi:hypothetical protein
VEIRASLALNFLYQLDQYTFFCLVVDCCNSGLEESVDSTILCVWVSSIDVLADGLEGSGYAFFNFFSW